MRFKARKGKGWYFDTKIEKGQNRKTDFAPFLIPCEEIRKIYKIKKNKSNDLGAAFPQKPPKPPKAGGK